MSFWKSLFGAKVPESPTLPSPAKASSDNAKISAELVLASTDLRNAAQTLGLVGRAIEGRNALMSLADRFDKVNDSQFSRPSPGYSPAELAESFRGVNSRLSDDEVVFWCHRMANNLRAEIAAINKRIVELRRSSSS
jgi:hypothetical protein